MYIVEDISNLLLNYGIENVVKQYYEETIMRKNKHLNYIKDRENILLYNDIKRENTTLAPDYIVLDGTIYHKNTQKAVYNALIYDLNLSTRARNVLKRNKIINISSLVNMTYDELTAMRNLGKTSADEIREKLNEYLNYIVNLTYSTIDGMQANNNCLVPGYTALNNNIYVRDTSEIVYDAPIENLYLSNRANNFLRKNGIINIYSLVGMSYEKLMKISNLGKKSADEIQKKLADYLNCAERFRISSDMESNTRGSILTTYDSPAEKYYFAREKILDIFHKYEFRFIDISTILSELSNVEVENDDIKYVLNDMVKLQQIAKENDLFKIKYLSFFETINSMTIYSEYSLSPREIKVLQCRILGETLDKIGEELCITRERVRQIENKAVRKLTQYGPNLYKEDEYAYIFEKYEFDEILYQKYLDAPKNIAYYLSLKYKSGNVEIAKAVDDEKLPLSFRHAINKYNHRDDIQIDGIYIPKQRKVIEEVIIEKYCKNEVNIDDFFKYYKKVIEENEITDRNFQLTEGIKRSRYNRLRDSKKLLLKLNNRIRYYDIENGDFTELLETLNLSQYKNTELSTRKFMIDYPDLMKQYDLRDEYELHNLLKKVNAEKENPQMVFGRMPTIKFGNFSREDAVLEILLEIAPVGADELSSAISKEYGVQENTVKAVWLPLISRYYHNGIYSVDQRDMPKEYIQKLKEIINEDFYFMSELKEIYRNRINDADENLLSPYNLKKMGFLIGSTYVIQNFPSAEAYFEHLLTSSDMVDIEQISKKFTGLSTYSACLGSYRHDLRIIEYKPYKYINVRYIEKQGISKEELLDYGNQVWNFLDNDEYFTIKSIKDAGFVSKLDKFGFGELFYTSILRENEKFTWQRIGGIVVFNPKKISFTIRDFLIDIVKEHDSITVNNLVNELKEKFGIDLDRWSVIEKLKNSDIYYDSISGMLYANYSTYMEKLE